MFKGVYAGVVGASSNVFCEYFAEVFTDGDLHQSACRDEGMEYRRDVCHLVRSTEEESFLSMSLEEMILIS